MEIRYSHAMEKLDHAQKYIIEVKEWLNEDCIDKGSYDQIDKLAKAVQLIRIILNTHNASE
jgi:vacuolar-type H+-ATPase catalytic subunit A/Vma1